MLSCATPSPASNVSSLSLVASPVATETVRGEMVQAAPSPTVEETPAALVSPLVTGTTSVETVEVVPSPTASEGPSAVVSPVATVSSGTPVVSAVPVYTYEVVNVYPHDPGAWTQGLVFEDGLLYEGTGRQEHSTLRRVSLERGDVLQLYSLPPEYFGEGITIWEDRIIQLTWKSRIGFVYDKESFRLLGTFRYPTEGWGITQDGSKLIMSDGTSTLHFWDPGSFEEIGHVQVHDDNFPVARLNELEYIGGKVYANVWQTGYIVIIDPETGKVEGWIDLTGILEPEDDQQPVDVLNGIAYDAGGSRLFVTGKWWPKLFEIELIPLKTSGALRQVLEALKAE
jgi:glutamine cyclotransferase